MNQGGIQTTHRGHLVCFIGVDGSGKTTHAKLFTAYLKENGVSCSYVWGAFRPFLSYLLFASTRVLGYWKYTKKNAYTDPLELAPPRIRQGVGTLLRLLFFVDYQMKVAAKIRIPLSFGRTAVCDRYFYDMLMELELSGANSTRFIRLVTGSLPRPIVTFLMVASDTVARDRRGFPEDFFNKRNKVLKDFSNFYGFIVIDSSNTIRENQMYIREVVSEKTSGLRLQG